MDSTDQMAETCPTIVAVGGSMDISGAEHFCLGQGPLLFGPSLARQKLSLVLVPANNCNNVIATYLIKISFKYFNLVNMIYYFRKGLTVDETVIFYTM